MDSAIPVFVQGNRSDIDDLFSARGLQARFWFQGAPLPGAAPLRLVDRPGAALFAVERETGGVVSTIESHGIARYLGLQRGAYLLLCSMLGLTQWRALILNPLLQPEDFAHDTPDVCPFARHACIQDYALTLERGCICRPCFAFFHCLGVEPELLALRDVFAHLQVAA
ncbi:MAG TPA: hypothetical protein ENN80_01435 [Candidatus Hydrogenedentes bacterium]|nr:hypothetical protein [Candidatus Hydrogenedentota bacterium]